MCHCGNPLHPVYGSRCEDCYALGGIVAEPSTLSGATHRAAQQAKEINRKTLRAALATGTRKEFHGKSHQAPLG